MSDHFLLLLLQVGLEDKEQRKEDKQQNELLQSDNVILESTRFLSG